MKPIEAETGPAIPDDAFAGLDGAAARIKSVVPDRDGSQAVSEADSRFNQAA